MKTSKQFLSLLLTAVIVLSMTIATPFPKVKASAPSSEMRGLWISMMDFEPLGLKDRTKSVFRQNAKKILKTAKKYKINAVFLHVRAHDDAFWSSDTFPAMKELSSKAASGKKASKVYSYDPLEEFTDCATDYDIDVHAYLNPYRIEDKVYLDPAEASSRSRVKKAVSELIDYDIDGIHFDDYFYHSTGGYVVTSNRANVYPVNISAEQKRANVNKLVKSIYKLAHSEDLQFGISPQGNYSNDMNSGADVQKWLSANGYVDYVAPQIYWTNSSSSNLYSERLAQFMSLKKNSADMYIGLALYRAGSNIAGDSGWAEKNYNLRDHVAMLRSAKADGYIMFSARFLTDPKSRHELNNLKKLLDE